MGSEPVVALVLTHPAAGIVASVVAHRLPYTLPQIQANTAVLAEWEEDTNIAYIMTLGVRREFR